MVWGGGTGQEPARGSILEKAQSKRMGEKSQRMQWSNPVSQVNTRGKWTKEERGELSVKDLVVANCHPKGLGINGDLTSSGTWKCGESSRSRRWLPRWRWCHRGPSYLIHHCAAPMWASFTQTLSRLLPSGPQQRACASKTDSDWLSLDHTLTPEPITEAKETEYAN